jgi:protein-S-isoprenylcysteine O-methyltransferase Ste14
MRPLPFTGPIFAALFWTAYGLWFCTEMFWSITKRARGGAQGKDRGSYFVILVFLYGALGLDFGLAFGLPQAGIFWHRTAICFAGVALMFAGIAFRYYAVATLGKFFTLTVATQTGQTVIQSGPYAYMRHPSYAGALITLAGVGLGLGNWAGLAALVGVMGIAYAYRIHVEESALIEVLGEPYKAYRQRTARIIPFVF